MKERKMKNTREPVSRNSSARIRQQEKSTSSISSSSRMVRSQIVFSNRSRLNHSAVRTTSSLPGLPVRSKNSIRSEKLAKWMERSSGIAHSSNFSQSLHSVASSSSSTTLNGRIDHNARLGRPNKASLLRSKTCPVPLVKPDYREISRKQKIFAHRCKTLSASSVSAGLPNGESLHGFLTGARYNSAFTLDSHSLEKFGVYVPKRDPSLLFVNPLGSAPPSAQVYGNCHDFAGSHVLQKQLVMPGYPINTQSDPDLQHELLSEIESVRKTDSTVSIERQLDEVFGPNEEGSSSCCFSSETTFDNSQLLSNENIDTDHLSFKSKDTVNYREKSSIATSRIYTSTPVPQDGVLDHIDSTSNTSTEILPVKTSAMENRSVSSHHSITSDDDGESTENEQDFISHEAQELTREILEECQMSTSSLASIPPKDQSLKLSIIAKEVTDKSLQTSFEDMSIDNIIHTAETGHGDIFLSANSEPSKSENSKRPVSAGPGRGRQAEVKLDERPQSAGACIGHRKLSTIFVDMTDLQK